MSGRESVMFECDHLRPVVLVDGEWHHIGLNDAKGQVLGPCGSIGYEVRVVVLDQHTVDRAIFDA